MPVTPTLRNRDVNMTGSDSTGAQPGHARELVVIDGQYNLSSSLRIRSKHNMTQGLGLVNQTGTQGNEDSTKEKDTVTSNPSSIDGRLSSNRTQQAQMGSGMNGPKNKRLNNLAMPELKILPYAPDPNQASTPMPFGEALPTPDIVPRDLSKPIIDGGGQKLDPHKS